MRWAYRTQQDKSEEKRVWRTWFAWRPVFFDGRAYWLERIERQYHFDGHYWGWRYRGK